MCVRPSCASRRRPAAPSPPVSYSQPEQHSTAHLSTALSLSLFFSLSLSLCHISLSVSLSYFCIHHFPDLLSLSDFLHKLLCHTLSFFLPPSLSHSFTLSLSPLLLHSLSCLCTVALSTDRDSDCLS